MARRLLNELGAWMGRNHIRIAIAGFVVAVLCMFAFLGGCMTITVVSGDGAQASDTGPDSEIDANLEVGLGGTPPKGPRVGGKVVKALVGGMTKGDDD